MMALDSQNLIHFLNEELKAQRISGRVLLDRLCVIDENSRKSPAYLDPNFAGFYYHLGKKIQAQSMLEIGFDLGLLSASFLISCTTVKKFVGFCESDKGFIPTRLGKRNIKRVMKGIRECYVGSLYDQDFQPYISGGLDLVIITAEKNYDKHLEYFDFIWPNLNENGIIVIDNLLKNIPSKQAYMAFVKSKNREPMTFKTRYGTGLIQK